MRPCALRRACCVVSPPPANGDCELPRAVKQARCAAAVLTRRTAQRNLHRAHCGLVAACHRRAPHHGREGVACGLLARDQPLPADPRILGYVHLPRAAWISEVKTRQRGSIVACSGTEQRRRQRVERWRALRAAWSQRVLLNLCTPRAGRTQWLSNSRCATFEDSKRTLRGCGTSHCVRGHACSAAATSSAVNLCATVHYTIRTAHPRLCVAPRGKLTTASLVRTARRRLLRVARTYSTTVRRRPLGVRVSIAVNWCPSAERCTLSCSSQWRDSGCASVPAEPPRLLLEGRAHQHCRYAVVPEHRLVQRPRTQHPLCVESRLRRPGVLRALRGALRCALLVEVCGARGRASCRLSSCKRRVGWPARQRPRRAARDDAAGAAAVPCRPWPRAAACAQGAAHSGWGGTPARTMSCSR
eukprot:scaffold48954_cov82-Phaeocystis_antarctica.AAC.2